MKDYVVVVPLICVDRIKVSAETEEEAIEKARSGEGTMITAEDLLDRDVELVCPHCSKPFDILHLPTIVEDELDSDGEDTGLRLRLSPAPDILS